MTACAYGGATESESPLLHDPTEVAEQLDEVPGCTAAGPATTSFARHFARRLTGLPWRRRQLLQRYLLWPRCNDLEAELPSDSPATASPGCPWLVLMVPGLFGEWVAPRIVPFGDVQATPHQIEQISLPGIGTVQHNAEILRDKIKRHQTAAFGLPRGQPRRPVALVGYSKGALDAWACLASSPELCSHIDALVCISGSFSGLPLVGEATANWRRWTDKLNLSWTPELVRAVDSMDQFQATPLDDISTYSIAAMAPRTGPRFLPSALAITADHLNQYGPNDGQVLVTDAVAPGSQLLGVMRADHWSIALPLRSRLPPGLRWLAVGKKFPRTALFHALLDTLSHEVSGRALEKSRKIN